MKPTLRLRTTSAIAACIVAVGIPSLYAAVVIPTSFGNGADTNTRGGTNVDDASSGIATSIQSTLMSVIDNNKRDIFLKYDLSGMTPTLWAQSTDARIDMYRAFAGGSGVHTVRVYGLNDDENADGWGATTLTANNAPVYTTPSTLTLDLTKLTDLGTFQLDHDAVAQNGLFSFNSAALLDFIETDTNDLVTFVFRFESSTGTGNFGIRSQDFSDGSLAPSLVIIPEPSTALLGGLGLLALLRRRR